MDYLSLSPHEQELINKLSPGLAEGRKTISAGWAQNLKQALNIILYECPELFNVKSFKMMSSIMGTTVIAEYNMSAQEYKRLLSECLDNAEDMIGRVKKSRLSAYDSALMAHDMLAKTMTYADETPRDHTIVGALIDQRACCEGISRAYKLILDRLGIPCVCVIGQFCDPENGMGPHMWNMISINGEWCHVDVTADLAANGIKLPRHAYFGLTDKQILKNHTISNKIKVPSAVSEELEYFVRKKRKLTNAAELTAFFSRNIKANTACFEGMCSAELTAGGLDQLLSRCVSSELTNSPYKQAVWAADNDNGNFVVKLIPR